MARLYTLSIIKENGTVYSTAVSKLLNSKNVLSVTFVTENFTGTSTWYSLIKSRINDDSEPDQFWSKTPPSTINTEINSANTTNQCESILLTVQNSVTHVNDFTKSFNPRFITQVLAAPDTAADSIVVYEEPQAPQGYHRVIRVDETVAAIKTAANA